METVIYQNGVRYSEEQYELETDFEKLVVNNSKILFGENTIFVDAKKKIDNTSFGGVIPDGFLIDFSDKKILNFIWLKLNWLSIIFSIIYFHKLLNFSLFLKTQIVRESLLKSYMQLLKMMKN